MVKQHNRPTLSTANRRSASHKQAISWVIAFVASLFLVSSVAAKSYGTSGAGNAKPTSDELEVSVDRTKIYQNETLELKAIGHLEIALDFSSLFNLRNLELPTPDVGALTNDFDIIDQQQKYNIQSVNGQNNATITWVYTLSPKRMGNLTIPPIHYKDQQSKPITVRVLKGNSNAQSGVAPLVFLEAELDKQTAYVQEQLTYTLRLYYADNLASGDLTTPVLDNAIVEQLGEQKKYYRMRNSLRYEVIERQYLIFPQQSGELSIAEQTFNGTIIDSRARKRKRVIEHSPSLKINIKPPADTFTGQTWLPAMSLNLSEKWDITPDYVSVGDSFTRTISIQALGLLGSTLPPITVPPIDGFKQYPDQPKTESMQHQAGVQSTRTESIAMVAVKVGIATLPEIKIPWWDTVNQIERVAIIPSRQITIGASASSSMVTATPAQPERINETEPEKTAPNLNGKDNSEKTSDLATSNAPESDNTRYYVIILLLIIGWMVTTVYLLKRRSRIPSVIDEPAYASGPSNEQTAFDKLTVSIEQHSPTMLAEMVQWAKLAWPNHTIYSLADIKQQVADDKFSAMINNAENSFYAEDKSTSWDGTALLVLLRKIRASEDKRTENKVLPNLYRQA